MSSQGTELRAAGRSLRSRPGLTTAIVLTLALGIGAVTALFSVVRAVLLRQPPFGRPDQLVLVYQQDRITGTSREPASVPDYYDLAARARGFASLAAFASGPVSLGRESAGAGRGRAGGPDRRRHRRQLDSGAAGDAGGCHDHAEE